MNLAERAILVSLKISLPTVTRRDKRATEDVEVQYNTRNIGRFNKDLIHKKFFAAIKSIESAARSYMYLMTVPWGDDDSRLLAVRRQLEFSMKMQLFGARFDAEADVISANWPNIVSEAEGRLKELFNRTQYPEPDVVRSKFKMRVNYAPVPVGEDLRVKLDEAQLAELRARINEETQAATHLTNRAAWQRLHKKVVHMAEQLAQPGGRVHESMLINLLEECAVLPDLNFEDDPKLNKAIALVKERLIVPVERLRTSKELKAETAVAAKKISSAMAQWMGQT